MINQNPRDIISRCEELKTFWNPRNEAMKRWYRLIEMVDELKQEKMESFVGNDPRALYNLTLHLLDADIPHRVKDYDMSDFAVANAVAQVGKYFQISWKDAKNTFRKSNPRQSLMRTFIGFMLATGWYAMFSMNSDDGSRTYKEPLNPAEVYPMWDNMLGLDEVAHIYTSTAKQAVNMAKRNDWTLTSPYPQWRAAVGKNVTIYDYWWMEIADDFPFTMIAWNAIVIGDSLVKFEPTRFKKIPIYIAPVGGLPDMGTLTEGYLPTYSSTIKLQTQEVAGDRWKAELGQSIIATNENIYKTWNRWWSFSLQLLRDTAQPRIFERSRSGHAIVKPEEVFKRGAIFRGGPDDSVDFMATPPIPLELRSTQLDLEAMMQRGGVSWAMHGAVAGQITAYVMSQIAASANQVMKPFHQAIMDALSDIDNDDLEDIKTRGIHPYGWKYPDKLPEYSIVSADYEVEIPGDLVQRATTARMLDPEHRLSYSYVTRKLFPDIGDPLLERAQIRADQAEMHPSNSMIALIQYYRKQAAYLRDKAKDMEAANMYDMMADLALQQLAGAYAPQQEQASNKTIGLARPEATPQLPSGRRLTAAEIE